MDQVPPPAAALPPDALVAHAAFVRRLAGALLGNVADAEDAAQETLLVGLERGPGAERARGAWLATVLRRTVARMRRSTARRRVRETRVARAEGTPSADEVAAREETLRAVVTALGTLDAASRQVVILRHYEDLPPRVIAGRLGMPVATVKSRLLRAHDRLRTILEGQDPREGERRRRALAAFAGLPAGVRWGDGATGILKGGATMGMGGKAVAAAAAAILAVGAGTWLVARSADGPDGTAPAASPRAETSAAESAATAPTTLAAAPGSHRGAVAAAGRVAAPEAQALPAGWVRTDAGDFSVARPGSWKETPPNRDGLLSWATTAEDGSPATAFGVGPADLAEAFRAKLSDPSSRTVRVLGRTATWAQGADRGRVAALVTFDGADAGSPGVCFVAMARADLWEAHAAAVEQVLGLLGPAERGPAAPPEGLAEPTSAVVASWGGMVPGDRVEGRVVHGTSPVAEASVRLLRSTVTPPGAPTPPAEVVRTGATSADGTFAWSGLEPGGWGLVVDVPGLGERRLYVETAPAPGTSRRVVVVYGTSVVEGRGFLRTGLPAGGRTLRVFAQKVVGTPGWWAGTLDEEGRFRVPGLASGVYSLSLELEDGPGGDTRGAAIDVAVGETKSVALGSDVAEPVWRGTARLASGTPVAGDPAQFAIQPSVGTDRASVLSLRPGPDGAFERRLPPGPYHVTLVGVGPVAKYSFTIDVGPSGLTRDIVVPGVLVSGTLFDGATGRSLPAWGARSGALVRIRKAGDPPAPDEVGIAALDGGQFRLFGIPPGRYVVEGVPPLEDGRKAVSVEITVEASRDVTGIRLEVPPR